jgi:plastocyanin
MSIRLCALAAVCASAVAAASCGGGGGSTPTSPSPGGSNVATITINGQNGTQAFSPNPATPTGRQAVFKNNDSTMHHIVLNDNSADTGDIAPGATSRAITIPAGGANFHCTIHPGMIGAFAPESGGAPPPCSGSYCDGY